MLTHSIDMAAEPLRSVLLSKVSHLQHAFWPAGAEPERPLAKAKQVHGTDTFFVKEDDRDVPPDQLPKADAVMTEVKDLWVGIQTADCLPVLVASVTKPVAAAVHAGWRGLCEGILPKTIENFEKKGVRPRDLRIAIGPAIGPCCFEVAPEVINSFEERWGWMWAGSPEKPYSKGRGAYVNALRLQDPLNVYAPAGSNDLWLNLKSIAKQQLINSSVPESAIDDVGVCTYCGIMRLQGEEFQAEINEWASYRRATHKMLATAGRQWSVIRFSNS